MLSRYTQYCIYDVIRDVRDKFAIEPPLIRPDTTLGLLENVGCFTIIMLLSSFQGPGEAKWSLYYYEVRGWGCSVPWPHVANAKSRSKLLCLNLRDSLWNAGGCG